MSEPLVIVDNVSKRFCRDFRRSLSYAINDLGRELLGRPRAGTQLRDLEFWAVDQVSFELNRGECLGLIGRNGAGKTTLLRMLNGLIKPDRGRIEVRGRVGGLIALGAGFNPILTGRENIYVNASVLGLRKREIDSRLEEIVDFAELGAFIDTPVQSYSSGMQVRLGFAIASSLNPDVLLLDEVLAVGDAAFRAKCFNRIHRLLQTAAVIFVSHNMAQVMRICDRLLLLNGGKVVSDNRNLGAVVATYHELTAAALKLMSEGTGDAKLTRVRIEDATGNELRRIQHGDSFDVVLDLELTEIARKSEFRVMIMIVDQEEVNVAQIMHSCSQGSLPTRLSMRLKLERVLLNAGRYSLAIGLLVGARGELGHTLRNALTFIVEGSTWNYAPITVEPVSVVVSPNVDSEVAR